MAKSDDSRRDGRTATSQDVDQAEDFLYHLHRGSEMLLKNKVHEAKEELERALHHQPRDAKSQDLLAGVYFRLGVYPRAIEIWSNLIEGYPQDATLRVNLALAHLKIGLVEEAHDHVNAALRIAPDHERGWGYLGLILWRKGRIAEARDAFLRAGQSAMANRMEEMLDEESSADVDARTREAATAAAKEIADGPAHRPSLAPRAPRVSMVPPPDVPERAAAPHDVPSDTLSAWIATASQPVPGDRACRVDDAGVNVRTNTGFALRAEWTGIVVCASAGHPVPRRVSGADVSAVLGGERPLHRYPNGVEAVLRAPEGRTLVAIELSDQSFFCVEDRLAGFASSLEYECNTLALGATDFSLGARDLSLVRFSGRGELVLAVDRHVRAIAVSRGLDARVRPSMLVGFTGALFASPSSGVSALSVVLRGEGTAFVTA